MCRRSPESNIRSLSASLLLLPPLPAPPPSAAEELSCLGVIQKKMTVNATDDSYDKARQSMAQAEEETRSRGAIVIKHGGRYQGTEEKKQNKNRPRDPCTQSLCRYTTVNSS